MGDFEKVIRERAYELWEHAGRPNERSDEFWFAARAEFERKGGTEGTAERLFGGARSRLVMNRPLMGKESEGIENSTSSVRMMKGYRPSRHARSSSLRSRRRGPHD